ncbi:four helix bundle protein [Mongoliitalea daihaiensis]|uniref:four helix bundle protein n=1 Tax=Mongoliitalea daihaiensis TaxID=2782006 RepID=UPI0021D466E4|nr:four helix bundle protein [Mongoliitalea daihaiensis]UJP64463.1 four helix bundle protein [Mongoliitalea daihaiensis]
MRENDLLERTFNFGVRCLKLLKTLPNTSEYQIIKFQLGKSSTSVGANYEEAQAGSSKADFKNKVRISLKEARESNYWLRVLKALDENPNSELDFLVNESKEIKNILASILKKLNESK